MSMDQMRELMHKDPTAFIRFMEACADDDPSDHIIEAFFPVLGEDDGSTMTREELESVFTHIAGLKLERDALRVLVVALVSRFGGGQSVEQILATTPEPSLN